MLLALGAALTTTSLILSALLCGLARRIAPRFGLVDRPGGRKAHRAPTPLGGGVAIWLTVLLVLMAGALALALGRSALPADLAIHANGLWSRAGRLAGLLGLATLVMIMGLIDDRSGLDWKPRLGVQVMVAAVFVVFLAERATLFAPLDHPAIAGGLSILWIVGLTNAFNFLDNMDGLAASVGLIAAALFVGAQAAVGDLFVPAVLLILVGALGGYLLHNRPPARLFMGDAGSNFLGFLLGTLTIVGTFTRPAYAPYAILAPVLVMAVPLYDMGSVILIRLREGRSPFRADRSHFSHRLVDRGLTPARAVATIDLVTMAGGLGALLLHTLRSPVWAAVVVGQTACLLGVVALLEVSTPRPERPDVQAPPLVDDRPGAAPDRSDAG